MRSSSLAVLLLPWLVPASVSAQTSPTQDLEALRELTFEARFEDAISAARTFLDRTDVRAADRNAGLELLAVAQIANRQRSEAEQTLQLLFSRDPGHRLTDPDASPPVISAFARARESRPTPLAVRLEHQPPTPTRREPPPLEVRVVEGADAVAELRLVYRIGGEGEASVVMTARPDGVYVARIPLAGDPSTPLEVSYHVLALAPSMSPLGGLGSPSEPVALRIPPESATVVTQIETRTVERDPAPTPTPTTPSESGGGDVTGEWWFWTLIAAVVIGAAVTTGIVVGTSGQGPESGTLGTARLMLVDF